MTNSENTRGVRKAKVLKPSEPVVRFTQSTFELLLELPVFFFQFFDAGKSHCFGFSSGV